MGLSKLRIQRFEGEHYGAGWRGKRTLIIGESHYHDIDEDPECAWCKAIEADELTEYAVKKLGIEEDYGIFKKVRQIFGGDSTEPKTFWNSVAFYNYQQDLLQNPKERVAEGVRVASHNAEAFVEIVASLKPERVIVLGKTNWRYLPSQDTPGFEGRIRTKPEPSMVLDKQMGALSEVERTAFWYSIDKKQWMLIGAIKHPSSVGFSARKWKDWAEIFLTAPSLPK